MTNRITTLVGVLLASLVIASCGGDDGDPIPERRAATLERLLQQVQRQSDAGACTALTTQTIPRLEQEAGRLPDGVASDTRETIEDGIAHLRDLAETDCNEQDQEEEEPTTPEETTAPETTAPETTERQSPETTPEEETTTERPPDTTREEPDPPDPPDPPDAPGSGGTPPGNSNGNGTGGTPPGQQRRGRSNGNGDGDG